MLLVYSLVLCTHIKLLNSKKVYITMKEQNFAKQASKLIEIVAWLTKTIASIPGRNLFCILGLPFYSRVLLIQGDRRDSEIYKIVIYRPVGVGEFWNSFLSNYKIQFLWYIKRMHYVLFIIAFTINELTNVL